MTKTNTKQTQNNTSTQNNYKVEGYVESKVRTLNALVEIDKYSTNGGEQVGKSSLIIADKILGFYNSKESSKSYMDSVELELSKALDSDENNPNVFRLTNQLEVAQASYKVHCELFDWYNEEIYFIITGRYVDIADIERIRIETTARIKGLNKTASSKEVIEKARMLLKNRK